jgi:ABC-type nickel/cobalt efflux system permease component RcnA
MTAIWEILALGLLLGVRHAFDADHLVAVTTIVSEYRNPLRAIWGGGAWGLGHTTTLLLMGLLLLLLKLNLPEGVALFFECLVGGVLILLGVQTFWGFRRRRVHAHPHHASEPHVHFHSHSQTQEHSHHQPHPGVGLGQLLIAGIVPGEHHTTPTSTLRPFFRVKSYLVGTVHGLAGSAALMLLVLASLKSTLSGVLYILIFGLGSVASMGLISIFISLPFSASSRRPRLNLVVQATAGTFSILFGVLLMYQVGIVEGLLVAG